MSRLPLPLLILILILILAGCGSEGPAPDAGVETPPLPLTGEGPPAGEFQLASDTGDTLRFRVSRAGDTLLLARYRRVATGIDSMIAVVDPSTKAPIRSFRRTHLVDGGSVSAEINFGAGFDGQARLILATSAGEREETNLRTPPPALAAAQIPLIFAALDFEAADSLSFNYVAPFERRAVPARIEIAPDSATTGRAAWSVTLQASGLRERYWFAAEPPHPLLRYEEITRNMVWTRP